MNKCKFLLKILDFYFFLFAFRFRNECFEIVSFSYKDVGTGKILIQPDCKLTMHVDAYINTLAHFFRFQIVFFRH